MAVDPNISDIVFNTDYSECKLFSADGMFIGWNSEKLYQEIDITRQTLARLGVEVPDTKELVVDFLGRI